MSATVLLCGRMFNGSSEELTGPAEILVEGNRIASIGRSVNRPPGAQVIDVISQQEQRMRERRPWTSEMLLQPCFATSSVVGRND
jgi:hypothetical protein